MTKKEKILICVIAITNLIATSLLTILFLPNKIPFLLNAHEIIISKITKWIMLLSGLLPSIFAAITLFSKSKKTQFLLKIALFTAIFENILYFSCFLLSKNNEIGNTFEIPISVTLFMPISVIIFVCATKLKNLEYLSKPAINFSYTKETEFLWRQTHIYARNIYFVTGIILFFISIIFCFLRYCLIELILFVVAIIISTIIVYNYSKSIYNKYIDMKNRKEAMDKKSNANEKP